MDSHSEKGLKTIEAMGTKPGDWTLTPIRWEYRTLPMPTKIDCPDCYGHGRTYVNKATGKVAKDQTGENLNDHRPDGWKSKNEYRACPTCFTGKGRAGRGDYAGSGKITVTKMQKVLVGIPVWAVGTKFDSRFHDHNRANCLVCELCSKSIMGLWSRRVPVHGKGADGRIHGMWIGEDCAKKILGVEMALTDDQKVELKKSVYKHWIVAEDKK